MRFNIKKTIGTFLLLLGLLVVSCSEDNLINAPKKTGNTPDPVKEYNVESLSGGAKINFKMPVSEDLLYVKAEYALASGLKRETKASLYKNYLIVDGFEKAGVYDVILYAVAKGEVYSEPTIVKIEALTPPYLKTRASLNLIETFGGVNISCKNKAKANLSIVLLEKDTKKGWKEKYIHHFNSIDADFSIRGYDTNPREFGVFVKDRWGNISDTLIKVCTPQFEILLDKTKYKKYILDGDVTDPHPTYPMWKFENLWDNKFGNNDHFHTAPFVEKWPMSFTIDLGAEVKFSRLKIWQRQDGNAYKGNNLKLFEVYGSNVPSSDGSWQSWDKLGVFDIKKPSGAPLGTNTTEDLTQATKGHEFDISPSAGTYRYVRFKILETWGLAQSIIIMELSFYGKYVTTNE